MYMMFMYKNEKAINVMGIRGELEELNGIYVEKQKEIFAEDPRAYVSMKIMMYI